ncbi:NAD(P)/FAD-dependent oxidoreductase [Mesonia sp. HuA40]|uniref:phytoene desaturase family protein n=1 Tax=Mesonia sp. HuA40 TaxID=2602761 RepID=UPI0011CBD8D2|nr:phytoene desaturase family protein [Mesonia sp. HuA40]TXK72312.1 phytoene desaturase [Mesonia sp. HuA40]
MKKNISIIGSGFAGLSAACYLAKAGHKVKVYEKNESIGGRARQYKKDGFTFDMGPTWYWMPDVFERFFADFDKQPSDYYELIKLSPAYSIYFDQNERMIIGDTLDKIYAEFERIEPGSSKSLAKFVEAARDNYSIAIKDLVYRPGISPLELITPETTLKIGQFFSTIAQKVRKRFKNPQLIQALEFPVLFLGAKPSDTPAFYNFMNYADLGLGTWHPKGGMFEVIRGIAQLAQDLGVSIHTQSNISEIKVNKKAQVEGLICNEKFIPSDVVLSGADYHHTESLLDLNYRQYSEKYWSKKTFAPSSLLFYVGFDKKLKNVDHHTLFFDVDFKAHAYSIYDKPSWPEEPLFYASFPSKTDKVAAPDGQEAGIFLIPLAPGIEDNEQLRESYFDKILSRFEKITQQKVKKNIIFKKSYCVNDFVNDYNSYKGNAYGLANTLLQTAFLRPKLKSRKVNGLYFTGQLTVPGPGVPPSLISGKLSAELIDKKN